MVNFPQKGAEYLISWETLEEVLTPDDRLIRANIHRQRYWKGEESLHFSNNPFNDVTIESIKISEKEPYGN